LSGEQLETRQIQDITGLQGVVPSLVVGAYYGTSLITLRGISTGLTSGAEDPSVATHINGVYQPRSRSVDSAMADLDRVEVLSGPQGTLYGRNATGGVVNYILKRPSSEFEGEFSARAGNYQRFGVQGRVTGPLSDNVRVLLSGIYDDQGKGYATNLLPNAPRKTLDKSRAAGGRFALDVGDFQGLNVQLEAIYLDTKTVPVTEALAAPDQAFLATFLGTQSFVPHKTYSNLASFTHSKYLQTSGTINIPLSDNINLKSITAFQDFKDTMLIDGDSSRVASVETLQNIHSKTFTQELNLNLEAVDGRLKSIFGAFYYDDDFVGQSLTPFSVPGFAADFATYSKIDTKSYAFFTDHTFSVTDRFRLQAGIRYNRDKKTGALELLVGGFPVLSRLTPQPPKIASAWTPRFGAQFDVTDDVMLYGQWSKGFKAGGFTSNSAGDDFDPERIQGPEVGIKTKLFDNRVRFNLSGYYYKIKNLQVQKVVDIGTFFVDNAAGAKIYGAEFSLNALLAPRLEFDASGFVQSAKYTDFNNCDETAFLGACGTGDTRPAAIKFTDVSGNWLNRAAPYSLNLGLQYTAEVGGGKLLLRGETYFSGKVRFSEFASATATQNAYSLQNAYLTYTPEGDRFTLRAYIKNIGNTDYKRSYFYLSAVRQPSGNYGTPRTFGIEGTVRF
jgi:iron complex outermembrane recepter protein